MFYVIIILFAIAALMGIAVMPCFYKTALGNGLIHGFIIIIYTVIAYRTPQQYPALSVPSIAIPVVKLMLVVTLLMGNYLGDQLI